MKKQTLPLLFALSGILSTVSAQVGVNTTTPAATLDVTAKNATGTTSNVDGLLVPRVDRQRAQSMASVPTSTLIFVNNIATGTQLGTAVNIDATGYYFFSGGVWVKLMTPASASVNIYNADGTLTGNRIVTQGANTLTFNGTATNAFSVDGTTLSVDAANNRVGIGTSAPENKFQVVTTAPVGNRYSLIDAPASTTGNVIMALRNTSALATGNFALLGFTNSGTTSGGANWGIGSIRTAASNEDFFFGNSLGSSYLERMRITATGLVGIGTATPQKQLHVLGGLQVTNEINVGGNATTAGSSGTIGQILTSAGAGAAPTWQTAVTPASVNIYNADGALTGNRIVTQAANTLAFTGTATNAFSVDGTTLSVDAANDRIGIGTIAPAERLDVRNGGIAFNGQTALNKTSAGGIDYATLIAPQTRILSWGPDAATSGVISFNTGLGGGAVTEKMRVHSNGNVGIGTATPQKALHVTGALQVTNELNVGGNASTAGSAGTAGQILTSAGAGAAPTWQTAVTPASVNIYNADGALTGNRIVTQAANTLAFNGTATNAFSVDGTTLSIDAANDRIGLGTTTPETRLHVVSTTTSTGRFNLIDAPAAATDVPLVVLRNTSPLAANNTSYLGFSSSNASGGASWGIGSQQNSTTAIDNNFQIAYSNGGFFQKFFNITPGGNVGVGTTTPQKKLHINGDMQLTNEFNVGGNATTAGSAGTTGQVLTSAGAGVAPTWQTPATPASVNIYNADGALTGNRIVTQAANTLAFNGTATNAFSVDGSTLSVDAANDRIGIGTTAPGVKLDVAQAIGISEATQLRIINTSPVAANNTALMGFNSYNGGGATWGIGSVQNSATTTDSNFNILYSSGGAYGKVFTIRPNTGNIGIGTVTPQKRLHVLGDFQVTGEVNVGGDATTAGSAGTTGQILTSAGAGVAPTWQTPAANVNIYNTNGALTGNRVVTQAANTLAFNGTATNAFSVDGTTFSVDAANDRVGLGTTTPNTKLEVASGTANVSGVRLTNLTSASPIGTGQALGVDGSGNIITVANPSPTGVSINSVDSTTGAAFNVNDLTSTIVSGTSQSITVPAGGKALFINFMLGIDYTNNPTGGGQAFYEARLYVDGVASDCYIRVQELAIGGSAQFSMSSVKFLAAGSHTIDIRMIRSFNNGTTSGANMLCSPTSMSFNASYLN